VLPQNATNVDVLLTKGSGPKGTVMSPEGTPVPSTTLALLKNGFNQAGFNSAGELTAFRNQDLECKSDENGTFAFKPELEIKAVAAASSNGFALVSVSSLATNSVITLEPFGRITGTLKRTSRPGTDEDLDVALIRSTSGESAPRINFSRHAVTDSEGRFEFDHVPPGPLQITYREQAGEPNVWHNNPLKDLELKPGQWLRLTIKTTDRQKPSETTYQPPPPPKRIPGSEVKGIVLSPDGKPAAGAEVALIVRNVYSAIGQGRFARSQLRDYGLLVNADSDGSFTLPMCQNAEGIIALDSAGFAKDSLKNLKSSAQVQLRKWGTIKGVLKIGDHIGSNTTVAIDSDIEGTPPIKYDPNAFKAKTDERGRFVFNYVPPGMRTVARLVPIYPGALSYQRLGTVDVKAGMITRVSLGGNGRTVIGRIKLPDSEAEPNFKQAGGYFTSPPPKILEEFQELKSADERKRLAKSKAFKRAIEQ
ncbi:MAG TPA: hypothetical protein VKA67_03355, partial [Verrucomicrobiae bacterium]|nr:hypothetical protein [Verrucomicrobiae bacterium]